MSDAYIQNSSNNTPIFVLFYLHGWFLKLTMRTILNNVPTMLSLRRGEC